MAQGGRAPLVSGHDLEIIRIFDAPRDLMWRVWTEPQHLARWWGPKGSTLPDWKADLRPGGSYRFTMRGPDGVEHRNQGLYREVIPPERLVMEGRWIDQEGRGISPVMRTVVTLEKQTGRTKLTLRGTGFDSASARDSHRGGWNGSFDRLHDYLGTL